MDGITDHPFRHMQKRYGNPDLMVTEFVRVERLCAGEVKLLRALLYDESQRPLVAQLYGTRPDAFRDVAVLLCRLGFDGIDINMGCPTKSVADSGAGAGLICTPHLAAQIVTATRAGVDMAQNGMTAWDLPDLSPAIATWIEERHAQLPSAFQAARPIPVSVKTRIGYDAPAVEAWIPRLLESAPAAISIHGRTLVQGYGGRADWQTIGQAVELAKGSGVFMVGNGDVANRAEALARVVDYGVDGVLIGRGSYGNPFVFCGRPDEAAAEDMAALGTYPRLVMAEQHADLFEASLHNWPGYSFYAMHKHLGWYVRDLPSARALRAELLRTTNAAAVSQLIQRYFVQRARWERVM